MNPEELYDTTLNPEHRHLIRLTTADVAKTLRLYNTLMGDSPLSRRKFILDNKLTSTANDDLYDDDNIDVD